MSGRTRRSPGAGPGIASRDAAKHLDRGQPTESDGIAGYLAEATS